MVSGNNIYFDRVVNGDLTNCAAWVLEADHILNFYRNSVDTKKIITGINIIDNLLFWTDNFSEPKKINIDRCIAGTLLNFDNHTDLLVDHPNTIGDDLILLENLDSNITDSGLKEAHISMIRRAPRTSPKLEMSSHEYSHEAGPVLMNDSERVRVPLVVVSQRYHDRPYHLARWKLSPG